jgi:hypothetical protein
METITLLNEVLFSLAISAIRWINSSERYKVLYEEVTFSFVGLISKFI